MVFNAQPPFDLIKTIDTGPITNHVNFAHNANGTFAYVTIGGLNEVKVFPHRQLFSGRDHSRRQICRMASGRRAMASRVYVGLENADALAAIDTLSNTVITTIPIGQAPQAVNYVPDAVPGGDGSAGLQPLGIAGQTAHLTLTPAREINARGTSPTSVSLFDQGADPDIAGFGHRSRTEEALCARPVGVIRTARARSSCSPPS